MRRKENRFQCPTVATQHNRMICSLYLPTPTQPRQGRGSAQEPPCAREIFCVPSCRAGALHLQSRPERWHPCARCWMETAPARGKDMGSHPLWGEGENNSCKLGVHATCGPLGPGQNHGRLSHEIAVAEDVLDDKRCLTASWYENVGACVVVGKLLEGTRSFAVHLQKFTFHVEHEQSTRRL